MRGLSFRVLMTTSIVVLSIPSAAPAQTRTDRVAAEVLGIEDPFDGPVADRSYSIEGGFDLLLVPDSNTDAVMAFDPQTGDLVDVAFIPADPANLETPIQAILSAGGDSILISDQTVDVVQEYALDGSYIGIFAPAGGPDPTILDNIRGIALRENGHLLVAVSAGDNADAIAEFDTAGAYVGNFVGNGEGGLDGPWAVVVDSSTYTTGDTDDTLKEYDVDTGSFVADLEPIDSFPEQVAIAGNDNLLVADFLGSDNDIVEVGRDGTRVAVYDAAGVTGARGVHELGNGNLLVSNGAGVYEIDRNSALLDTKIDQVSARFISRVRSEPCIAEIALDRDEVHAGDELTVSISLEHRRAKTVTVPFHIWIEDTNGEVVLHHKTRELRFSYGDTVQQEVTLEIPRAAAPGSYRLLFGLRQMQQGVAGAGLHFTVVE